MRAAALAIAGLALVLGACTDDQDPTFDPGSDLPATTSNTLPPCPDGGPDATTPDAGCVAEDGSIQRP